MSHGDQFQRIKAKLTEARIADHKLKVFGAKSHHYQVGPPVPENVLTNLNHRFKEVRMGFIERLYRSF